MKPEYKWVVAGALAVILIVIYGSTVWQVIKLISQTCGAKGCEPGSVKIDDWSRRVLTGVGSINAGVVTVVLGIAQPAPLNAILRPQGMSVPKAKLLSILTTLYILVWIGVGLATFFFGAQKYPDANSTITDMGYAWFATACLAVAAFFGIDNKDLTRKPESE